VQEELLAPVSRINFRKKLKVIVNEISKANGRYDHERPAPVHARIIAA
jgi:hypothetical protein